MFKEFAVFLKTGNTKTDKNYFKDFLVLFSIVFAIGISISFLKSYYYDINLIDKEDFEKLNWKTVISYVLVVPLIEEIIFRAPLLVPKAKIYSILISSILVITSLIYIENSILNTIFIIIVIIIQLLYNKNDIIRLTVNKFISQNYLIMIYLTSISFGTLHMTNYEEVDAQTFISIIGRVIGGFYFAFIVTKYTLKSSYLLHAVNNIIPFLILLVVK